MSTNADVQAAVRVARDGLARLVILADALDIAIEPPPPPPPPPFDRGRTASERMSIYAGFGVEGANFLGQFEQYLGRPLSYVGNNQDQRYDGASASIVGQFTNRDSIRKYANRLTPVTAMQLAFTNPTGPDGQGSESREIKRAGLQRTLDGRNDATYLRCFAAMKEAGFAHYIHRYGSEGDILWPPHSFVPMPNNKLGNDDLYRAAFARVAKMGKSILGDKLLATYTCTSWAVESTMICADGQSRRKLDAGYPGDDVCDIIGCDIYLSKEPLSVIERRLETFRAFATAHGKSLALDEWGITPDGRDTPIANQTAYIKLIADFCNSLPARGPGSLAYHSFFAHWSQSNFFDHYAPQVQAAVLQHFGALGSS